MISLPYEWDDIAVAMPASQAPAGRSPTRAALRRLGHTATIGIADIPEALSGDAPVSKTGEQGSIPCGGAILAIAALNIIYFGAQLLRGVL